jgi:hypothetical protein
MNMPNIVRDSERGRRGGDVSRRYPRARRVARRRAHPKWPCGRPPKAKRLTLPPKPFGVISAGPSMKRLLDFDAVANPCHHQKSRPQLPWRISQSPEPHTLRVHDGQHARTASKNSYSGASIPVVPLLRDQHDSPQDVAHLSWGGQQAYVVRRTARNR